MSERVRVAAVGDVPAGSAIEVAAGGFVIALFHLDGRIHAIDGMCAHAGGPLAKGRLDGTIVTCPWHGWQYDVTTGRHCLSPTICQRRFEVSVEGDDVFVLLPGSAGR